MNSARSGVLVVDKPSGRTSHDVVAAARRLFGQRAVGHAGTLDPMATGVLVLMFGEACKLSDYLTGQDKTYRARVSFGVATDSLDADGQVTHSHALESGWLSLDALNRALGQERERTEQVPPNVSAIQEQGQRAHARARRGEQFELPARNVRVAELRLLQQDQAAVDVELTVSKGYYVRAFARDLGSRLGAAAHLSALRRIRSGAFTELEALPWPAAEAPALIPLSDAARRALPVTQLTEEGVLRARQGKILQPTDATATASDAVSAWYAPDGTLIALGQTHADGQHRVVRGFVTQPPRAQ